MKWRSYRSSLSLKAFIALTQQLADPWSLPLSTFFPFSLALVSYLACRILIALLFKNLSFLALSIPAFSFRLLLISPSYALYQPTSVLFVFFKYDLGGPYHPFHMLKVALKACL